MIDKNLVHVYDIVITWDNGLGFVSKVEKDCFWWVVKKPREAENACSAGSEVIGEYDSPVYKQIGCQFNERLEEHPNCIEPLSEDVRLLSEIRAKLNEVIEYINNKEQADATDD